MNFLKLYSEYASEITDAPLDFHTFTAIVTAGIVIGKTRYIQFGSQKLFPNFYLLIIAPSSLYRKSTVLNISRELVFSAVENKVFASDFSQEKMAENLSNLSEGIFYFFEWKTFMGILEKNYMSGTKSWLTELYDGYTTQIQRKKETFIIDSPCVSILSATTSDWFVDSLKSGDIEGGFLARFLFVHSRKKIRDDAFPKSPNYIKKIQIETELKAISALPEIQMSLSNEAMKKYNEWYKKFSATFELIPTPFRTLFSRLNINCLKFSIVLETCKTQKNEISIDTLEEAISLVNFLKNSLIELCTKELSLNKHDALEKKVVKLILEKGGKLERAIILRYANLSSKVFQSVIETLEEKKIVTLKYEKKQGSFKPCQMVILNGNLESNS